MFSTELDFPFLIYAGEFGVLFQKQQNIEHFSMFSRDTCFAIN